VVIGTTARDAAGRSATGQRKAVLVADKPRAKRR
jgi:hypothetical protein